MQFNTNPQKHATRFFATVADIGSLFVAVIYISYVGLMMILHLGFAWLNWTMLGITAAYIIFFLLKIFYLNSMFIKSSGKVRRSAKLAYKYTKFSMRIINAAFVALSLLNIQLGESHVMALIGIVIVGITFAVSILWDIGIWITRRKLRELRQLWTSLTPEEKQSRVEIFMGAFIRAIDNTTIIDDILPVGVNVGKIVGRKFESKIKAIEGAKVETSSTEPESNS